MSFSEAYTKKQEEFRAKVINYYNDKRMIMGMKGEYVQVAEDSAQILLEKNPEIKLFEKEGMSERVVAALGALVTMASLDFNKKEEKFHAGVSKGYKALSKEERVKRVDNFSNAIIEAEIRRISKNPIFSAYSEVFTDRKFMEKLKDERFLKNTMIFSERFTQEVADGKYKVNQKNSVLDNIKKVSQKTDIKQDCDVQRKKSL